MAKECICFAFKGNFLCLCVHHKSTLTITSTIIEGFCFIFDVFWWFSVQHNSHSTGPFSSIIASTHVVSGTPWANLWAGRFWRWSIFVGLQPPILNPRLELSLARFDLWGAGFGWPKNIWVANKYLRGLQIFVVLKTLLGVYIDENHDVVL